jgi:hypothetical protein
MSDPTIAVGWAKWVPEVVVNGVLEGILQPVVATGGTETVAGGVG